MRGKRLLSLFLLISGVIFSFSGGSQSLAAQEENPAGYTVESIQSENQVDTSKSYFYIGVQPERSQTFKVKIKSLRKEPRKVKIQVNNAITGNNGVIDYTKVDPELDESLKQPLTSFVKVENEQKEVTVQNFEEKIVSFVVTPPKDTFPGVKLGAVRFVGVPTTEEQKATKDKGITPQYAFVIALMVTEDKEQFDSGAELHLKHARLQLVNGERVFEGTIQNDQPKVLTGLSMEGYVTKKGSKDKIAKVAKENLSVAPNSNFGVLFPAGLDNVRAGKYVMTLVAKGDDRKWKWTKEFQVGEKEAAKINDEAVYKITVPKWVPYLFFLILIMALIITIFLIQRRNKWQQIEDKNHKGSEGSGNED